MLPLINSSYFHDLLEGFAHGVVIFNAAGEAYAFNAAALGIFGLDEKELTGSSWQTLFAPLENSPGVAEMMRAALAETPLATPVESLLEAGESTSGGSGQLRHLSLTASLLQENDKLWGVLVSLNDVSHIFALHEREKRILEEVTRAEYTRAESLKALSMAVAHQIRNPVTAIGGFARILKRKADERQAAYLDPILEGSLRLEAVVSAVSAYTRAAFAVCRRESARKVLEELAASCRDRAGELGLSVQVETQANTDVLLTTDTELLGSALRLLAENSLEALATVGGGRLVLTVAEVAVDASTLSRAVDLLTSGEEGGAEERVFEPGVAFRIRDTGPGIAPDVLPYVFDPFYTTKAVGVGMGLTTAKRALEELRGEIALACPPAGGTEVLVRLPRVSAERCDPKL